MYKYNYEGGDIINGITFIKRIYSDPKKREQWAEFMCHCGNLFTTQIRFIRDGRSKSCGCIRYELAAESNRKHPPLVYIGGVKKMPPFREQDIDRFWSKVALTANPEKCWNWIANNNGRYGMFNMGKRNYFKSNRVAYFLFHKEDPETDLVLHKCNNSLCCNPAHLSLGDQSENMRDMMLAGRGRNQFEIQHSKY